MIQEIIDTETCYLFALKILCLTSYSLKLCFACQTTLANAERGRPETDLLRASPSSAMTSLLTLSLRGLRRPASAPLRNLSTPPSASDIQSLTSNKAFFYIFTRTLPLRSQPEFASPSSITCAIDEISSATTRLLSRYAHLAVDDRAAVHLHAAVLAVATHHTLLPRLASPARVLAMLRGAYGAGTSRADDRRLPGHWAGMGAMLFSRDKMGAVRRMTANAERDFGGAFAVAREDGAGRHVMRVEKCLYARVCRAEGVPELTQIFCALDRALFSHVSEGAHGVRFEFDEGRTLGKGEDVPCEFVFEEVEKAGG